MADTKLATPLRSSTPQPTFSSDAPRLSSPPSSPPCFPWELKESAEDEKPAPSKTLTPPPKTAFSLLGKRKVLNSISENVRPAKKATRTKSKPESRPALTQLQISLGQRVQTTCVICGMEYVASSAEDRKLHDIYHRQHTEGYDVGKDFTVKARDVTSLANAKHGQEGDVICVVQYSDTLARRKRAQAVLEVVQKDLGAVPINEKELWSLLLDDETNNGAETTRRRDGIKRRPRYAAYMYVRGTKCIGFLLAERIKKAHRVVGPTPEKARTLTPQPTETQPGGSALAALKARREAEAKAKTTKLAEEKKADNKPLELSKSSTPADLGVARLWTSPAHRKQNVARSLLDAACAHGLGMDGNDERRVDRIAFSQPTAMGTQLARRWTGRRCGWLVYID
ncbi:Hypothetical protein R9X50_00011000 [Acrodontium crateriforme]|uniref:Uncharacterized protein n=1 Tax=Acrodontium crateriforme TaxID=150365 RepID=A0AAQ3LXF2_9PEZI|nr:Hypothetical protein R9X50_00011000 [Acrodontium crateriforme]